MRYFLTTNASRPYIAAGLTFSFEPVQNRGGSWLGVLAVAEDAAASALAAAKIDEVDEITLEYFEIIKKKLTRTPGELNESPTPQRVPLPGDRGEAVRLAEPQARALGRSSPAMPATTPIVEAVTLGSTAESPPFEPLLDTPAVKTPKRYAAKPR